MVISYSAKKAKEKRTGIDEQNEEMEEEIKGETQFIIINHSCDRFCMEEGLLRHKNEMK